MTDDHSDDPAAVDATHEVITRARQQLADVDTALGILAERLRAERTADVATPSNQGSNVGITAADVVEIWKKTVDVQEHFNDLGMRVRNFGLTLLVGILGGTALAVKEGFLVPMGSFGTWSLASLILLIGAVCWIAFYFLDRRWYHRLLFGAVEHGRAIENAWADRLPSIGLTNAITKASRVLIKRKSSQVAHVVAFATVAGSATWVAIELLAPGNAPRGWLLLLMVLAATVVAFVVRGRLLPNWEMKARYRLDFFYASIFAMLLVLAWAANVAVSPNRTAAAAWRGFPYRTGEGQERRNLAGAPAFETLQECTAWGNARPLPSGITSFECATRCRQDSDSQRVVCSDSTGVIPLPVSGVAPAPSTVGAARSPSSRQATGRRGRGPR